MATDQPMYDTDGGEEVAERALAVVEKAKFAVAAYLKKRTPSRSEQADLAGHAIRLAKLDEVCRAGGLDSSFQEAAPEDVQDLLAMLAIVPFELLLHGNILLLNPSFRESSTLVGGADADLIAGDLLVDFKVTKQGEMNTKDLDQLLGYFLLTRHLRRANPEFPEVKRVALYFCRHAHLWVLDAVKWTEHPEFAKTEEWFFMRAKEVFARSVAAKTGNRL